MKKANKYISKYIPNILTLLRCFLAITMLYINNHIYLSAIIILAGITDFGDGFLARKYNLSSKLGGILDPIADKLFTVCTCIALYEYCHFPIFLFILIIMREIFLISGGIIMILFIRQVPDISAILISKIATTLQLLGFLLFANNAAQSHAMILLSLLFGYYAVALYLKDGIKYLRYVK